MNWKITRYEEGFNTYWSEKHELNEYTFINIKYHKSNWRCGSRGYHYNIYTSKNLYELLKNIPETSDDFHEDNERNIVTKERALEIVDIIKTEVSKRKNLKEMIVYVRKENMAKYKNGEEIMAYFHPKEDYIPLVINEDQIETAMVNNPGGSLKNTPWSDEELDELYDNF